MVKKKGIFQSKGGWIGGIISIGLIFLLLSYAGGFASGFGGGSFNIFDLITAQPLLLLVPVIGFVIGYWIDRN